MAGQQQGRHDPKEAALAAARCLNPHPEQVTDPEFLGSDFFDARDAVQVKYEMVRKVRAGGAPVTEATAAFGYSRPAYYAAAAALESAGLEGLVPARPGPRGAHKLTEEILAWAEEQLAAGPRCARRSCPTGSRRPSACACTPGRSRKRWPAAGSAIPKAADLPAPARKFLGVGGVGFPRNLVGGAAAGGHGPVLLATGVLPVRLGRRRDRFQGGRRGRRCPSGSPVSAVIFPAGRGAGADDGGVLPVTPYLAWCLGEPERKFVRWGRSRGLGYCRFEHADQIRFLPFRPPGSLVLLVSGGKRGGGGREEEREGEGEGG